MQTFFTSSPLTFSGCIRTLPFASRRAAHSWKRLREVSYAIPGRSPRVLPAEKAFDLIKSGDNVFVHGTGASPTPLLTALHNHVQQNNVKNVTLHHFFLQGATPWLECKEPVGLYSNCLFIGRGDGGSQVRAVNEGRADFVPVFLNDIPKLFYSRAIPLDASIIQVSVPDDHGFCTLGTSVDIARSAIVSSKVLIALVNPRMPRTSGDGLLHASHLDVIVHADEGFEPYTGKEAVPEEAEAKIGKLIAENLIEDGSTLQLGIGHIPNATLAAVAGHRDLGIHTEMFSDGMIDLVEKNVITNRLKTTYPGRIVTSFVYGSRRLYDFVDNNPLVHFGSVEWVVDPSFIRQQSKLVAINSAIEIDLTGQICADSIGAKCYSGFGGQVEFMRGAAISDDGAGRPIIAMTSQCQKKGISKIVPHLKQGAGVVTSRAHAHYVVTEYGIAQLWGRSIRQRAAELIRIAHPDHRATLEKAAFERLKVMPSLK